MLAARKVAIETAEQADERRGLNRECAARKRGMETADQAYEHRKLTKLICELSAMIHVKQTCLIVNKHFLVYN